MTSRQPGSLVEPLGIGAAKLAALALCLSGLLTILVSTRWGAGISPDSISYIAGARALMSRLRFTFHGPVTHYPPGFSAALAIIGAAGIEPLLASRILNAILFAANLYILWRLISTVMPSRAHAGRWPPIMLMGVALTSVSMLELHSMAWSEPLFLAFGFYGLFALVRFLRTPSLGALATTGLCIAAATLTRYVGLSLIASGIVSLLLLYRRSLRARLVTAASFAVFAFIPVAVWLTRNLLVAGTLTNRSLDPGAFAVRQLWEALDTASSWLLIPASTATLVKIVAVGGMAGLLATGFVLWTCGQDLNRKGRSQRNTEAIQVLQVLLIFALFYGGEIVASNLLFDTYTPFEPKILAPVFLVGIIALGWVWGVLGQHYDESRLIAVLIPILMIGFLGFSVIRGYKWVRVAYDQGLGFNDQFWRESETVDFVKTLPQGVPIYSNAPEGIYLHAGRNATAMPRPAANSTEESQASYMAEASEMLQVLADQDGALVIFNIPYRFSEVPDEDLLGNLPLEEVYPRAGGSEADAVYLVEPKE